MAAIPLEAVDSVTITTLVENVYDVFMPDQGPAHRAGVGATRTRQSVATMLNSFVPDQLVAEHGFSVLLEIRKGPRRHRLLFDLGVSPNGMVENVRRIELDPKDVEAIICSHGHFDHTAGLSGLADQLGKTNLGVNLRWQPAYRHHRGLQEAVASREPFLLQRFAYYGSARVGRGTSSKVAKSFDRSSSTESVAEHTAG